MDEKGTPIEVRKVANGYLVILSRSFRPQEMVSDNETYVFGTIGELNVWIKEWYES